MRLEAESRLEAALLRGVGEVSRDLRNRWRSLRVVEPPDKVLDPDNPTTDLDQEVDLRLREVLQRVFLQEGLRPAWLSEESADRPERLEAEDVLIVDPIDGTRNLVAGRPEAAISVAWWHAGDLRFGLIVQPFLDQTFVAWRGQGARLNGQPCRVTRRSSLHGAHLLVSRFEHRTGLLAPLDGRVPMTPMGSAAYKIACVAAGLCDGTFTAQGRSEWDLAAGTLLVQEAGGLATDGHGEPLCFNQRRVVRQGFIASGPDLHPLLREAVALLPVGRSRG